MSNNAGWRRLFQYYKPAYMILVMIFLAFLSSTGLPGVGFFIIKTQFVLYERHTNDNWEADAGYWLTWYVGWIFLIIFVVGAVKSLFGYMGEKMTYHIRIKIVEEILHKQISWFDREDRAPGILTNIISAEITSLNGMTSETLVTLFELGSTCVLGFTGGLIFSWEATLIACLCSPIMVVGMYMMSTLHWGHKGGKSKDLTRDLEVDDYSKSNALLSDAIINYRTIISLG